MSSVCLLSRMPDAVIEHCLVPFLSAKDAASMAGVNKRYNEIFSKDAVWKKHYVFPLRLWEDFGISPQSPRRVNQTWKDYATEPYFLENRVRYVRKVYQDKWERKCVIITSCLVDMAWLHTVQNQWMLAKVSTEQDGKIRRYIWGASSFPSIIINLFPQLDYWFMFYDEHGQQPFRGILRGFRLAGGAVAAAAVFYYPSGDQSLDRVTLILGSMGMMYKGLLGFERSREVFSKSFEFLGTSPLYIKAAAKKMYRNHSLFDQVQIITAVALMALPVFVHLETDYAESSALFTGAAILVGNNRGVKNALSTICGRITGVFRSTINQGSRRVGRAYRRLLEFSGIYR